MSLVKVTRNYQVTIPQDVRVMKKINIGDTVLFTVVDDRVELKTISREKILDDLFGVWNGKVTESSKDYVAALRKEWDRRGDAL